MKKLLLLLGLCLAASSLSALAPHPSMLTVQYRDQMLPVQKVIGTDPVVIIEGKEKRIRTDPLYEMQRVASYSSQDYVDLSNISLAGLQMSFVASREDIDPNLAHSSSGFGTTYLEVSLKSRRALHEAFLVVVCYSNASFNAQLAGEGPPEIMVHELPDIPAGEKTPVKVSAAVLKQLGRATYFVQIFDSTGAEIPTNNLEAASHYYAQLERAQLRAAVSGYLAKFANADHAAVPVMMAQPRFRAGLTPPSTEVSAILSIQPDGTVSEVKVRGVEDASVHKTISDALGGWLFLPQLKAGRPVMTKVQVPLKF